MPLETTLQTDLVAAFSGIKNTLVGFAHTELWAQLPLWSGFFTFHSCRDLLGHILCGWRVNYSVPLILGAALPRKISFQIIPEKLSLSEVRSS
jgi:hypothetical protein